MVIRLNQPKLELDDCELIDRVVGERQRGIHRTFFQRIHPQWRERVVMYIELKGDPEQIERWEEVAAKDISGRFKNLYLSPQPNSIQKPILDRLRERTLDFCPACGEDGTPNTLDHYLPKDLFPEFSITMANLFPMCDICQGNKGVAILNDEGERQFLHPYFDAFLDQQAIVLDIGEPFNAPASITLAPHSNLPEDIQRLIGRHLEGLDIVSRYHHFFQKNYIRLLRLIGRARAKNLDVVTQIEQFRDAAFDKSINSWGHVFYEGVLRNDHLLRYLEIEDLPEV